MEALRSGRNPPGLDPAHQAVLEAPTVDRPGD